MKKITIEIDADIALEATAALTATINFFNDAATKKRLKINDLGFELHKFLHDEIIHALADQLTLDEVKSITTKNNNY